MIFSSPLFLCLFLPGVVLLHTVCPRRFRNTLLLLCSLLFYLWGEPLYLLLMVFTILWSYTAGRLLDAPRLREHRGARRAILSGAIAVCLGLLGVFKYTDFLLGALNGAFGTGLRLLHLALPIGISFYTFQALSYVIDVYRGTVRAQARVVDYATYLVLFPQLIAGPIVRYAEVEGQLGERRIGAVDAANGLCRFLIGLGKKVLLANQAGALYETLTAGGTDHLTVLGAWGAALAYTFQIYFDFSGYSDMAIGLGRLFGFTFPENFRYPYEADSITDFWRRWHITLSAWFREYLYIPLGGNRCGKARQLLNLLIVWALTGLWHGADWNFLLWGLYFFLLLAAEKTLLRRVLPRLPALLRHVYALFFIVLGWVLFAAGSLSEAGAFLSALFGGGAGLLSRQALYELLTHLPLLLALALGSTRWPTRLTAHLLRRAVGENGTFVLKTVWCLLLLALSLIFLTGDGYNPFLYLRF